MSSSETVRLPDVFMRHRFYRCRPGLHLCQPTLVTPTLALTRSPLVSPPHQAKMDRLGREKVGQLRRRIPRRLMRWDHRPWWADRFRSIIERWNILRQCAPFAPCRDLSEWGLSRECDHDPAHPAIGGRCRPASG